MKHWGLVVLAAAIMVIAYVGKDHRGTLLQDTVNYFNLASVASPPDNLAAASSSQGSQYSAQLENQISPQSQGRLSSPESATATLGNANTNDTALSASQLASGFPDPLDEKQIEQYVLQKYQEGYSAGLHK